MQAIQALASGAIAIVHCDTSGNTCYSILENDLITVTVNATVMYSSAFALVAADIVQLTNGNIVFLYVDQNADDMAYFVCNTSYVTQKTHTVLLNSSVLFKNSISMCEVSNGAFIATCIDSSNGYVRIYRVASNYAVTSTYVASNLQDSLHTSVVRSHANQSEFIVAYCYYNSGYIEKIETRDDTTITTIRASKTLTTACSGQSASLSYPENGNILLFRHNSYSAGEDIQLGVFSGNIVDRPKNKFIPAVTTASGQVNTNYWDSFDNIVASASNNNQSLYFALSSDGKTSFSVFLNGSTPRKIIRDNEGTWEYNSATSYGNETWSSATINTMWQAFKDAMGVSVNQMDVTQLQTLVKADFFDPTSVLDLGVVLHTDSDLETPQFSGMTINYDANSEWEECVCGVDYESTQLSDSDVRIKALAANNLKIKAL